MIDLVNVVHVSSVVLVAEKDWLGVVHFPSMVVLDAAHCAVKDYLKVVQFPLVKSDAAHLVVKDLVSVVHFFSVMHDAAHYVVKGLVRVECLIDWPLLIVNESIKHTNKTFCPQLV